MIPVMCIVQEGQLSQHAETALRADIADFSQRAFAEGADIDWIVVPKGSGFTAGKPSNSMIASLFGNRVLQQDERAALLRELGEICMRHSGCTPDEVVTSVRNPQTEG